MNTIEFAILDFLQTLRTPLLDGLMVFVSSLGDAGFLWIALAAVLLVRRKWRRAGAILAAALVIDLLVCNVAVKPLVARLRPCDINTAMEYLIERPHGWSFPSGHTAASFASVAALYLGKVRAWPAFAALAAAIAFSRLYLYVHFPTDVLGGIVIGSACGAAGYALVRALEKRRGTLGK